MTCALLFVLLDNLFTYTSKLINFLEKIRDSEIVSLQKRKKQVYLPKFYVSSTECKKLYFN